MNQISEFNGDESQRKRYQDLVAEVTKEIQGEQEKIAKLDETTSHLQGMNSELIGKQQIISTSAEQLETAISALRQEITQLMGDGNTNPIELEDRSAVKSNLQSKGEVQNRFVLRSFQAYNRLKEDILTETLIYDSKKREIQVYEPVSL